MINAWQRTAEMVSIGVESYALPVTEREMFIGALIKSRVALASFTWEYEEDQGWTLGEPGTSAGTRNIYRQKI